MPVIFKVENLMAQSDLKIQWIKLRKLSREVFQFK